MAQFALERPDAELYPHPEEPSHVEVLRQLESIVGSAPFRNSKRYPAFLRFIVEHTLSGRTDLLKERTLGVEVFHRPSDYDTNADPVVRVTAGEIRKRLAQYYQIPGHEGELRVDLPVGSYVPHFLGFPGATQEAPPSPASANPSPAGNLPAARGPAAVQSRGIDIVPAPALPAIEPVPSAPATPSRPRSRFAGRAFQLGLGLLALLMVAAGTLLTGRWQRNRAGESGLNFFWSAVLGSESPTLIVIGTHSLGPDGKDRSPNTYTGAPGKSQTMLANMTNSDMIPVSDVISYGKLTDMLTAHSHAYRTQGAPETTFDDLQRGPVVLLGALDNIWTMRLTSKLRYRLSSAGGGVGQITDAQQPGAVWQFDNAQRAASNTRDYALVASFYDPQIEQPVLIAAGIGKNGTAVAAEFLTGSRSLKSWLDNAHLEGHRNVELLLATEIIEGKKGPPHVMAAYSW